MKKIIFAFLALFLLLPMAASAADVRVNNDSGDEFIGKAERVKNVYSFGNNVVVDADVQGDLVSAGNYLVVNGDVQYGVIAAGANVVINGNVNQSIRAAGGSVQVNGTVNEDLLVAGGTVRLDKNARVNGDVAVAGGNVTLDGSVGGYVKASGSQITLNGVIAGNITIGGVENLTIGKDAVIHGDISYKSNKEVTIEDGAQVTGEVTRSDLVKKTKTTAGIVAGVITAGHFVNLLSLYALILILTYLLSRFTKMAVERGLSTSGNAIWCGLLTMVLVPVVAVILVASILGFQAGLVLSATALALLSIAKPLGAITLGTAIYMLFSKNKKERRIDWLTGLIGAVAASVLMLIPFVGWIVPFVFYLIALGVVARWIWDWAMRNR